MMILRRKPTAIIANGQFQMMVLSGDTHLAQPGLRVPGDIG